MLRYIFSFLILTSSSAFAADDFCASTEGIDQIKSYLGCQSLPSIASCAALGTYLGARNTQKSPENQSPKEKAIAAKEKLAYEEALKKAKDASASEIASDLHEDWKKKLTPVEGTAQENITKKEAELARLQSVVKQQMNMADYRLEEAKDLQEKLAYAKGRLRDTDSEASLRVLRNEVETTKDSARREVARRELIDQSQRMNLVKQSERWIEDNKQQQLKLAQATEDAKRIEAELKALRALKPDAPVYKPAVIKSGGEYVDVVNSKFESLPESLKADNLTRARTALEGAFAKNSPSELANKITASVGGEAPENLALTSWGQRQSEALAARALSKAASLEAGITFDVGMAAARVLGKAAPVVAGGLVTAAVFVATEALGADSTGCSEEGDTSINLDSSDRCKPVYKADAHVMKFLSASESKQRDQLKTPKVCEYYKALHKKFLDQPKFVGLKCGQTGFTLTTKDSDGLQLDHRVTYKSGSKAIRQINLSPRSVTTKQFASPIELTDDGRVRNLDFETVAKTAMPIKLYIMDAANCCNSGDVDSFKCQSNFNGGSVKEDDKQKPASSQIVK